MLVSPYDGLRMGDKRKNVRMRKCLHEILSKKCLMLRSLGGKKYSNGKVSVRNLVKSLPAEMFSG